MKNKKIDRNGKNAANTLALSFFKTMYIFLFSMVSYQIFSMNIRNKTNIYYTNQTSYLLPKKLFQFPPGKFNNLFFLITKFFKIKRSLFCLYST